MLKDRYDTTGDSDPWPTLQDCDPPVPGGSSLVGTPANTEPCRDLVETDDEDRCYWKVGVDLLGRSLTGQADTVEGIPQPAFADQAP